jgi:dolichyl-phosphate-mannose-protein mannosyltransferase
LLRTLAELTVVIQNNRHPVEKLLETKKASFIVAAVLTTLAFALRFYKINQPDQVV